ncbi:MAG: SPW repeat protein [Patescibacteria group bacterium]
MRWIHRIEIVVGVWLVISPWVLGYASSSAGLWNSVVFGAVVGVAGLWGMFGEEV